MKSVIHEIHRRSLWQVLGIYLAVAWIVLQVIDVIGNNVGLPDWVAPTALVLLLLGLPVVIATAFVQEGMSARHERGPGSREDSEEAAAAAPRTDAGEVGAPGLHTAGGGMRAAGPGKDPSDVGAPAASSPTAHHRLTWRNALYGGIGAFTILGIVTAGYLFMRSAGIGPAGTLVAQGVLEEGAEVVLADFDSADPDLADVVTGALRIDLVQSPTIRLVPRSLLSAGLRRMQRDEDAPLSGAIARELAEREGYGAVIEGEVGTAGSGYVLTASILGGEDWLPLAGFRATAKSEDGLIDAIESLSRDIRDKAGESLRSVHQAPGLRQVTTSSLEALRIYTRADVLSDRDRPAAVELLERAVVLDPEFAMAYRKIGVVLSNMGVRRADQVAAVTRAFELGDRLPPTERHLTEAEYNYFVVGDRDATVRAFQRALEASPDDPSALNNLAIEYMTLNRDEDAEELLERTVAAAPFALAFTNLAGVRVRLGRFEDAQRALDDGIAWAPDAEWVFENARVRLAAGAAEYDVAEAAATAYGERFRSRDDQARNAYQHAVLDAIHGRLQAAEDRLGDARGVQAFFANPMSLARDRALLRLVRGDSAAAIQVIVDAHGTYQDSLSPGDRRYGLSLEVLFEAGGASEAESLYAEWEREVPDADLGPFARDGRREMEARRALARGASEESMGLWEAYERECPGTCSITAALGLARVHEARGDASAAITEYRRFLEDRRAGRWAIDVYARGPTLERLGQLYDEQGDPENAARYYTMFVELWEEADEELQPRVRAAQTRLDEILRDIE